MIYEFYSGSYGKEGQNGIVRFRMDTEAETITKQYAYKEITNPSYLGFNGSKTILYTVQEETPEGAVHALKVGDQNLTPLKSLKTRGADPCHVSLDESGKLMFVDNYSSGSLAVFRMDSEGLPQELSQLIVHEGKSVHPIRQTMPHIHYTKEHDGKAYVVDLGLDQVFVYDVNQETAKLEDKGCRLTFSAGAGPRHLEFHRKNPGILYVVCELSSQVMVWELERGQYVLKQTLSTVPEDFRGETTAAAIKMQNELLFVTNRGHDSVAVYKVLPDGQLEFRQIVPSGGKTPRDFTIFGDYMVIANQDSDKISVLKVDWEKERLEATNMSVTTVKPTCIRKY